MAPMNSSDIVANLRPDDESTHLSGSHEYWNESFYFNFFDSKQQWSGFSRIGFSPNQGYADGFICLYFPDGSSGFIRNWEASTDPKTKKSAVGAMQHICHEPFKKWQLLYQGPIYHFREPESMANFGRSMLADVPQKQLNLDITFVPLHPPFDFHDSMRKRLIPWQELSKKFHPKYLTKHLGSLFRKLRLAPTMSGANHYEQAGQIEGSITVDDEVFKIKGYGQRDHSWGVRDMRVPSNWRWLSCQFGDTLCFNAIQVDVLALRVSGGYVYHEGQLDVVIDWLCEPHYEDGKHWPDHVAVSIKTRSGKQLHLHAKAITNIPVLAPVEGDVTLVTASRGLYEWQGKKAYGIIEFMEQLK